MFACDKNDSLGPLHYKHEGLEEVAGERRVQWLIANTALAEDVSSVPGTHVRWLIAACNFTSRGIERPFWPPLVAKK